MRALEQRIHGLAQWLTRLILLAGGVALLTRIVPADRGPVGERARGETGRGRPRTPPSVSALSAGHETVDVNTKVVAILLVGLLGGAVVIIGGMVLLHSGLERMSVSERPSMTPEQTASVQPPKPHLQANAVEDLVRLSSDQNSLLHGYAWLSSTHDAARIPLDRAMSLMVGRKLDPAP